MVVESLPALEIHTLAGSLGRTYTVISNLEQDHSDSGTNTFTRIYARGVDSVVEWAPGSFARWPRRMSLAGTSLDLTNGTLYADEGVGTMTLRAADTLEANALGLNRVQVTHRLVTQFQQLGYVLIGSQAIGRLVVSHDDLVFSENGFQEPDDPGVFALNVADWFSGGRAGRFLAIDNQGFNGASMTNAMTSAGHAWIVSTSPPLTVSNLLSFDGVFLLGRPIADDELFGYVNAGGNVYLGGVGVPSVDIDMWNPFLQRFGLGFTNSGTGVADFSITGNHPILAGVDHLYGVNGTSVTALQPSNPEAGVLVSNAGTGLFAVWGQTNRHSSWRTWFSVP